MTLQSRISTVRTLTIIQIIIPLIFIVLGGAFAVFAFISNADAVPSASIIIMAALMLLVALAITIGLPWIVLNAIKVRKENWATAAFVSLILQIVCGGGLLSVLPIISLVLLLNKEASAYIGMK